MRRPVDAADPVRHVLLGLLLEGPSYGYELARAFAPETELGSVVHLGSSHLYALLTQLERTALVVGAREEHGARPARRVYTLTVAGREAALSWVTEPVTRPRDMLIDFPLKLYLARRIDRKLAIELVKQQRRCFADYLVDLDYQLKATGSNDPLFRSMLLQGRVLRTNATLDWLDWCLNALGEPVHAE
jgi:DNA-binding PadR family transcriptional regulator